jgi:protocatechuate 3,4-dioxygenase beta subunit
VASQRATTDPSGTFHFTGLPPGNHTFSFEASGFFKLETKLRVDSGITAAHLDIELIPHSSISGRVLDEEGNSVAGVRVEITQAVRGTGTTWSVWGDVADSEGRYRMGCDANRHVSGDGAAKSENPRWFGRQPSEGACSAAAQGARWGTAHLGADIFSIRVRP